MGVRQYIGARYVPKFFENSATGDSTWAPGTSYEPLTIVAWNDNSYTSKKAVPPTVGAPNLNLDYWVLTGDIGSGIGALSERMDAAESDIDDLEEDVNDIKVNTDFFLYPTGDTTDRAADIAEKLRDYGVCYFANGDFYVYQEITMPEGASLIGVGNSKLHLMYDGVLIRMNSYCNVSGLTLIGQGTQIPYEAFSKGSRIAIYIDGDATSFDSSTYTRNMLAFVNNVTSTTIAKINEEALSAGIKSVLNIGADEEIAVAEKDVDGFIVYEVTRDANWIGTAVKSTDKSGFGGDIEVLVGFNEEGKILGYEVLKHAETPGLGARAGEWFRTATSGEVKEVGALSKIFFGKPDPAGSHNIIGRDIAQGELKVSKDGGDIDAITASTITSRAFLNAVNNAYKVFKGNVSDVNSSATGQY